MSRILLIEDDSSAQLLYRNRLTELGYSVVVSPTGALGLHEARAGTFDLYLVDIGLGSGIDGFEVCRRLKTIPEIHGVPVVLISGHVKTQEDLHRGYEAGCQSFLVKGDLMHLEDVVRAMLRIKSLQDDLAMQNRLLEERNRRFEAEKVRSADLEQTVSTHRTHQIRERRRPDGLILVDGEGLVRSSDRGARELFGAAVEGKHLAQLAPGSRLEASVRNARTEPDESVRFEILDRGTRSSRSISASIYPFATASEPGAPPLRLVLLFDAARGRSSPAAPHDEGGAMRREWAPLVEAAREVFHPEALLGKSEVTQALRTRLHALARGRDPVLVEGPGGSGKGFVARILHFGGGRTGAFLTVSCSAGPAEIELELFGAPATSTQPEQPSAFHRASGGTLFLQDVERIPRGLQGRLLEVLQPGSVRRGAVSERIDVRLVAGTRVDFAQAIERGEVSAELGRLLSQERLTLQPLSQRREDIEVLSRHFLARHQRFSGSTLSPEAMRALMHHGWPDNVRELELTLRSACESVHTKDVQLSDLPAPLPERFRDFLPSHKDKAWGQASGQVEQELNSLLESLDSTVSLLDSYEKVALLHALRLTLGDKLAAAKLLKVGKSTFYRKLKLHGIT